MGLDINMTDDKHILVNHDFTEKPPVYLEKPTESTTSEGSYQSPKFFGCCEAHIGWTIWYSIKCSLMAFSMIIIGVFMDDIIQILEDDYYLDEYWNAVYNDVFDTHDDFRMFIWSIYGLACLGNIVFFICFGLLMYGIHG